MELGLKGRIQEMKHDLSRIRAGTLKPAGGPLVALATRRDVALIDYLSAMYPAGCDASGVFDVHHLYSELKIDPSVMTVQQVIDLDQDSKWLVPEIFRDAVRKGIRTTPIYNKLVAATENVAQPQVNLPFINLSEATPERVLQGETIPLGTISYGNKLVEISKQGIGIQITDEAIRYTSINLLAIFLQDTGIKLGQKLNDAAIDVLINGDQAGGTEASAVIGVENTTPGLTYLDILRVWIRASRLGRSFTAIIAGEAMANKILNLAEFKNKEQGAPQQSIVVNETLPSQSQLYVSAKVPDNQAIFVDPSLALVQLTANPLTVEADRLVSKQINESYATVTTGFANIFRDARIIVDQSVTIGAYPFPAWMTPTI